MPGVLTESATVVIVGAGVAGMTAASLLRTCAPDAQLADWPPDQIWAELRAWLARLLHSDTAAREFGELMAGLA
jgi:NADH dehydrogenase FAD-containing subunit